MTTRKRDAPYFSRNLSPSLAKRLRPASYEPEKKEEEVEEASLPFYDQQSDDKPPSSNQSSSSMVVVTGLSHGCSVLKLKSRFEMYGAISRLRIDHDIGYITFRSKEFAEAAMAASLDPSLGITVESQKVSVSWPNDPLPGWREGVGLSSKKLSPGSKLLRPEVPLRRHGRGNKLSPGSIAQSGDKMNPKSVADLPFKGRQIIAYDDLL